MYFAKTKIPFRLDSHAENENPVAEDHRRYRGSLTDWRVERGKSKHPFPHKIPSSFGRVPSAAAAAPASVHYYYRTTTTTIAQLLLLYNYYYTTTILRWLRPGDGLSSHSASRDFRVPPSSSAARAIFGASTKRENRYSMAAPPSR